MTELTAEQESVLRELLATYTCRKGWDTASVVLGYARACGLSPLNALRIANETKYAIVGMKGA
jgi:hypothetical protein